MIGKTIVLVICLHKRVKSIVFAASMKFCDEPGLAILISNYAFADSLKTWKSRFFLRLND